MSFSLSRGHAAFGLSACARLATDGPGTPAAVPPGYTSPTHKPEFGHAPAMQARTISGKDGGQRAWTVIFRGADEVMSGLTDWMKRENIAGAHLAASKPARVDACRVK